MLDKSSATSAASSPSAECIICRQPAERGIRIAGQLICDACEREIVHTDVSDVRYRYFVECMRGIWSDIRGCNAG